ncbi:transport system permease protein [Shewanella sediminis HAW-EB3]|uniref:Transport system permease protein n=1 Tax=Shewanella sediminis (strain HAW-EB3) TaxID=425104 RepID=A8FV99_SHESH|nr:iron ABC transporter permease [Shewanella sediminis]ABV36772.1 transport system permease protein [Shewanella sediminis HAW-EB3]
MRLFNPTLLLALLIPLAVISPLIAIVLGSADISLAEVIGAIGRSVTTLFQTESNTSLADRIIIELRMPRALMAMVCGAGLAVSGSVLQSVTRNPLADPYLFGISAGASLGAILALTGGLTFLPLPVSAFLGSLIAVAVVVVMARDGQVETLVLSGVAISFLLSSIANLVLYFGDPQAMQAVLFWSLGSFSRATWSTLMVPGFIVIIATVIIYQFQRPLQALMAGDESAHTQGVAVLPLRLGMLILTALMTSSLVAACGGIGFVGLMVPHIVRMLIGSASSSSLIATALLGGVLMVWVDLLARLILPAQELPVGVMTAMLGSVFFIGLLVKRKQGHR